jgi:hypothetical protein
MFTHIPSLSTLKLIYTQRRWPMPVTHLDHRLGVTHAPRDPCAQTPTVRRRLQANGRRRQTRLDGPERTHGGDSAIQRGRPNPHGRHFGLSGAEGTVGVAPSLRFLSTERWRQQRWRAIFAVTCTANSRDCRCLRTGCYTTTARSGSRRRRFERGRWWPFADNEITVPWPLTAGAAATDDLRVNDPSAVSGRPP